jgi:hypothetical protein
MLLRSGLGVGGCRVKLLGSVAPTSRPLRPFVSTTWERAPVRSRALHYNAAHTRLLSPRAALRRLQPVAAAAGAPAHLPAPHRCSSCLRRPSSAPCITPNHLAGVQCHTEVQTALQSPVLLPPTSAGQARGSSARLSRLDATLPLPSTAGDQALHTTQPRRCGTRFEEQRSHRPAPPSLRGTATSRRRQGRRIAALRPPRRRPAWGRSQPLARTAGEQQRPACVAQPWNEQAT